MADDLMATFEQEAAVLQSLLALHPGPWGCTNCGVRITSGTGWKPRIAFVFNPEHAVYRAIVDVFCDTCVQIAAGAMPRRSPMP